MAKPPIRYTLIQGKPYAWVTIAGRSRLVPVKDPAPTTRNGE